MVLRNGKSHRKASAMSEERLAAVEERLARALEGGGASVTVQDPRVSQIQNWLLGLVGTGIIVVLGWLANSVDNLNRNFAAMTQWKVDVERRLGNMERKP
jgi:hypothetical protein